jgi:hypothetical protein
VKLSRRNEPEVVIEFDEPIHIDKVEPALGLIIGAQPIPGWTVWARWRGGQIVGFGGPGTTQEALQEVKKAFWDSCLIQYVTELRLFAGMVKN